MLPNIGSKRLFVKEIGNKEWGIGADTTIFHHSFRSMNTKTISSSQISISGFVQALIFIVISISE